MVCFHFLCSVLHDDYKLQHSAYFWQKKSCISIWFRSSECLTSETHLADVIYHRALVSFPKETAARRVTQWQGQPLRSGRTTVASESESELRKVSKYWYFPNGWILWFALQSLTLLPNISLYCYYYNFFFFNFWERMSKALLGMGIVSQTWWGITRQDFPPVIPEHRGAGLKGPWCNRIGLAEIQGGFFSWVGGGLEKWDRKAVPDSVSQCVFLPLRSCLQADK